MLLILVVAVLIPQPSEELREDSGAWVAAGTWLAALILVVLNWIFARRLKWKLERRGRRSSIVTADRLLRTTQWLGVILVVLAVLVFDWLAVIRASTGDLLMVDEFLAILPALAIFIAAWWIFHPFEARVREAKLIRDLDEGVPISPPPGRAAWVGLQVRMHLLLWLLPIFMVATVVDLGGRLTLMVVPDASIGLERLVSFALALPVIWFAPLLVVRLMDAVPLPPGEVRTALEHACRMAQVRVRDLMLWRTGGVLYNGAVTGFLPRMRWVLLTDGLLQRLERDEVLAVMAHELAHVRLRHMIWLAASLVAMALLLGLMIDPLVVSIRETVIAGGGDIESIRSRIERIDLVAVGLVLLGTLVGFGWVSRRFERQADAFAAVRLSMPNSVDEPVRVRPEGVDAMYSALGAVAKLSGVGVGRRSWRHGSIASRQRHLRSLEGLASNQLPIDRVVKRIKGLSAVIILLVMVYAAWDLLGNTSADVVPVTVHGHLE